MRLAAQGRERLPGRVREGGEDFHLTGGHLEGEGCLQGLLGAGAAGDGEGAFDGLEAPGVQAHRDMGERCIRTHGEGQLRAWGTCLGGLQLAQGALFRGAEHARN